MGRTSRTVLIWQRPAEAVHHRPRSGKVARFLVSRLSVRVQCAKATGARRERNGWQSGKAVSSSSLHQHCHPGGCQTGCQVSPLSPPTVCTAVRRDRTPIEERDRGSSSYQGQEIGIYSAGSAQASLDLNRLATHFTTDRSAASGLSGPVLHFLWVLKLMRASQIHIWPLLYERPCPARPSQHASREFS